MSIPIDNFKLPAIITGFPNNYPEIRPMVVADNLATITTAGYLNNSFLGGQAVSPFSLLPIIYNYTEGQSSYSMGWFQVSITSGIVTLFAMPSVPGEYVKALSQPTAIGNLPVYGDTTGDITQSIPALNNVANTSATPGTVRSIWGEITSTATTQTSGNIVGVRGSVSYVGASGGFIYGCQGKVIPTGTLSSSEWSAGVFGQLDISGATINAGQIAPIWGDYGTTSGTMTSATGCYGIAMTNTTAAILAGNLYLYGAATNLMLLDDNNGLSGATYFKAAGTSSGSAGYTSGCDATKVLTISVNGTTYYIPLFAQNS